MLLMVPDRAEESGHAIAIFGLGLIGRAIRDALHLHESFRAREFEFSWNDASAQEGQIALIERAIEDAAAQSVSIVWSAGKGGFYTGESELEGEFSSFERVLSLARRVSMHGAAKSVAFHLVSSAGGLFEGQRLINRDATPSARRPYGALKLKQERALEQCDVKLCRRIYRPSSVYGYTGGGRMGLLPTILMNGILHRELKVVGNQNTLRDFVYVKDVGEHIAKRALERSASDATEIEFLVSGRPCSIYEIQHLAEHLIRRKVYFVYSNQDVNALDMTYAREVMPLKWAPVDLETGMRRLLQDVRVRGKL